MPLGIKIVSHHHNCAGDFTVPHTRTASKILESVGIFKQTHFQVGGGINHFAIN